MGKGEFCSGIRKENGFDRRLDVNKSRSVGEFGGNIGGGKKWDVNGENVRLLGGLSGRNRNERRKDGFYGTVEGGGSRVEGFK